MDAQHGGHGCQTPNTEADLDLLVITVILRLALFLLLYPHCHSFLAASGRLSLCTSVRGDPVLYACLFLLV